MAGTSIIEHFSNILKYLKKLSEEISNADESKIEELKQQYKLEELKNGILSDIEQIENLLQESLSQKEEDTSNPDISDEIKNLLISMHDSAIDIHEHFLNICNQFIEYIESLNPQILDSIKEQINNGVIKLQELKEITDELSKIIEQKKYEAWIKKK